MLTDRLNNKKGCSGFVWFCLVMNLYQIVFTDASLAKKPKKTINDSYLTNLAFKALQWTGPRCPFQPITPLLFALLVWAQSRTADFVLFIFVCLIFRGHLNSVDWMTVAWSSWPATLFLFVIPKQALPLLDSYGALGLEPHPPWPRALLLTPLLGALNITISPASSYLLLKWSS